MQTYDAFLQKLLLEVCTHQVCTPCQESVYDTTVCTSSIPSHLSSSMGSHPDVVAPGHAVHGTLHVQELLKCLKELLRLDKAWLPHQEGYSMYIRPFAFSSAHTLGISKPGRYLSSHNNRKGGCSLRSYLAEQ